MDNLLDKNGCKFKAVIDGKPCEGVIYVEGCKVYLLQNVKDGSKPDHFPEDSEFKYSWVVAEGKSHDLRRNKVENLEIVESISIFASSESKKKLLLFL